MTEELAVETNKRKGKKRKINHSNGPWTTKEHQLFMKAIKKYGNSWTHVSRYVGTRLSKQCCSHAQKYFQRVSKIKAEEQRKNPETQHYIFVVTKCYYNTTLVPKKRILSYSRNRVAKLESELQIKDSEPELQKNELINGGESEEVDSINDLSEGLNESSILNEAKLSRENETQFKLEDEEMDIVITPVLCYPDYVQDKNLTICPIDYHCNPFRQLK